MKVSDFITGDIARMAAEEVMVEYVGYYLEPGSVGTVVGVSPVFPDMLIVKFDDGMERDAPWGDLNEIPGPNPFATRGSLPSTTAWEKFSGQRDRRRL